MATPSATSFLRDVDAYTFDVFGTTVDWFSTIKREVAHRSNGTIHQDSQDAADFANEWRQGYYKHILKVNKDGEGTMNVDVAHRQILDQMLASPRWSHLANVWNDAVRKELVYIWHELDVYEDTLPGLTELGKSGLVVALSNGNYRLMVDMAKNKKLPWDGILSAELFGTYKPLVKTYLSASHYLGVAPERIAMVAAHIWDLKGAAEAGFKTIYVPRPAEDTQQDRESTRSKVDGGTVDLVVKNFEELAALAAEEKAHSTGAAKL